jgi:hypothetical protein
MAEQPAAPEAPVVASATTEAPPTEPSGYMQNNGDFGDNAPEVIRNLMEKKQWTNVEQLATGYSELEKFKGGSVIPEADDTEGWAKINAARGVPESHDKYEYAPAEGMPELNPELMDGFRQFAHSKNLSQEQFAEIVNFQLDAVAAQNEAYEQQMQEMDQADTEATKIIYGVNYENAVNDAKLTADKHGFSTALEERGIRNVPVVTQMLNHIANLEAEDGINRGAAPVAPKTLDQQMQDIKANPAFLNKFDPGHKALMVEFNELNRKIVASRQAM